MKRLTTAEEKVMQILWDLGEGFVKDILARYPEPRPAYTTVSSIIRILEKKNFIGHRQYGNTYLYIPRITRDEYKRHYIRHIVDQYFDNSYRQMVSFFAREKNLNEKELEEILKMIRIEK